MGVEGVVLGRLDGESGEERRRRLCWAGASKSISSSSSLGVPSRSVESSTPSSCPLSCVAIGLNCDDSCILSTRSNFLRGFGRGVACVCASGHVSSSFALLLTGVSKSLVWRVGAITNRLAGVNFLNCRSGV